MKRSLALLTTLLLALTAQSSAAEKKDKQAEGLALIERARALSDIRAPGSPPFRLRARARLLDPVEGSLEGTYTLAWMSDEQWREEITFPNFSEVRIGKGTTVWRQRNINYRPEAIHGLIETVDLHKRLRVNSEETVERIRGRQYKGVSLRCVKLKKRPRAERELCIDSAGTLAQAKFGGLTHEYSDFVSWAGKSFPGSIRVLDEGKTVREIRVERLDDEPLEPALFTPAAGAVAREGCLDPDLPEIQEHIFPDYPDEAKRRRIQGTVSVYALIGADGRVYNVVILRSADPSLAASTLETVQRWRFNPATCGSTPVETETVIEMSFHLY
jgi:TonB family protein